MQRDLLKFANFQTDIDQLGNDRKTGFCTQFITLFKRNAQYLLRNPRSLNAILMNGIFTALLVLALFWNVGKYSAEDLEKTANLNRFISNLLGLAFMMTNNICFSTSSGVIIQMPLQVPVFRREKANKMYTSTSYFFARFWSNTFLQLFYPISTVLVVFGGLKIKNSFENIGLFILYAIVLNLVMVAQGYFCGTLSDND